MGEIDKLVRVKDVDRLRVQVVSAVSGDGCKELVHALEKKLPKLHQKGWH